VADSQSDLAKRIESLERRLGGPDLLARSEAAEQQGELRAKVNQLPDRAEANALAQAIGGLAERQNVIVEWTARDLDSSLAVSCCCCCCCCVGPSRW
jgi:hypothetical protein